MTPARARLAEVTAEIDVRPILEAEARSLEARFPGSRVWFGHFTRAWWAYVPCGPHARLVTAAHPQLLDRVMRGHGGLQG